MCIPYKQDIHIYIRHQRTHFSPVSGTTHLYTTCGYTNGKEVYYASMIYKGCIPNLICLNIVGVKHLQLVYLEL